MIITKNNALLKQKKIAGFILKPDSPEIHTIYTQIKKVFQKNGIQVYLENADYRFDQLCQQSDFLVALGGDGTLISVARRAFHHQKAVMGINLGSLGFLTDIMPHEIDAFLKKFHEDHYRIDHRMMIEAKMNGSTVVAFNDIVISRKTVTGMIKLDARVNDVLFNTYNGDGLIISTPTGSTAYNLSCNGPVVYPLTDAFIVTPISPHSLTQRPLVLPADFQITLTNKDAVDAIAIIDGHDTYELKPNESISIHIASSKAKLIHRLERNYFEVLNKKLQWGAN
jgi:NAD+ kinase